MNHPWNLQIVMTEGRKQLSVLISACLLGVNCRYDGGHSLCQELVNFLPRIWAVPVCPEQMGGLPTPRLPVDIVGGDGSDVLNGSAKCINRSGDDVSLAFIKGAREALKLARITGANLFLGRERSPSCGVKTPHCEAPGGEGVGVTVALLRKEGLEVLELGPKNPFPTAALMRYL